MKVPIDQFAVIDLEAPVLPAYEAFVGGSTYWLVWCKHCRKWHRHGPAEGHREAHCNDPESPYWRAGYNLAYAGRWKASMSSAGDEQPHGKPKSQSPGDSSWNNRRRES